MVKFNPYFRYSASRLLASTHFDQVRNEKLEVEAPYKFTSCVDAADAFDY